MKKYFLTLFTCVLSTILLFSQVKNPWSSDGNGISYKKINYGNVGIGTLSAPGSRLTIQQIATGGFSGAMDITSSDDFHTVFRFRNTTVHQEWQFMVGGSNNQYQLGGTLAIFNTRTNRWPFYIDPNNENIGIGSHGSLMTVPKSRLHIFNGDINIEDIGNGIIMKSPNGKSWRITIDNNGNFISNVIDSY